MTAPLSIRLGPLDKPLRRHCKRSGLTPAEYIRSLIAADLDLENPTLGYGFSRETVRRKATKNSPVTKPGG